MRVLVPIADDTISEYALGVAEELAADGGEIVLVAVGELPETSAHEADTRRMLQSRLEDVAVTVRVPVVMRVELAGDPVRGILDVARETGSDRIVIATEAKSRFEGLLSERSVSHEVREHSGRPVDVVTVPRGATA